MTTETTPELPEIAFRVLQEVDPETKRLPFGFKAYAAALLKDPQFLALAAKQMGGELHTVQAISVDDLANRFLAWPLPETVCADICASDPKAKHRSGTNLLMHAEAKEMLTYVLDGLLTFVEPGTTPQPPLDNETKGRLARILEEINSLTHHIQLADVGSAEVVSTIREKIEEYTANGSHPDRIAVETWKQIVGFDELAADAKKWRDSDSEKSNQNEIDMVSEVERLQTENELLKQVEENVTNLHNIALEEVERLQGEVARLSSKPHTDPFLAGARAGLKAGIANIQLVAFDWYQDNDNIAGDAASYLMGRIRAINPEDLVK